MIHYISGEFILKSRPNGGTAVLLRSLLITCLVYTVAIGIRSRLSLGAIWQFDSSVARSLVADTIPWFGVIFAGVYVALYSRFASQWNYLANLYNQMMATAVQCPPEGTNSSDVLRLWQAGFIEDAEDLHLVGKPMFASVVKSLLTKQAVRDAYITHALGGTNRLIALEQKIDRALGLAAQHREPPASAVNKAPDASSLPTEAVAIPTNDGGSGERA